MNTKYTLNEGYESLERIKLMMIYDLNKTLKENINEQTAFEMSLDRQFSTPEGASKYISSQKEMVKDFANVVNYLRKQGLVWFFDKLREFCFSVEGIALDVFLNVSFPALGKVVSVSVYGALLLWELYQLYEQGTSFTTVMNVVFAALGVIFPAMSKSLKVEIGAAKGFKFLSAKTQSTIKNVLDFINNGMKSITKFASEGLTFVEKYMGAQPSLKRIVSSLESKIKSVGEWINKNMVGGQQKVTTTRLAVATSKSLGSVITFKFLEGGIEIFSKSTFGKNMLEKGIEKFGSKLKKEELIKSIFILNNPQLSNTKNWTFYRPDRNGDRRINIDSKIYIITKENQDPDSTNFGKLEIWK